MAKGKMIFMVVDKQDVRRAVMVRANSVDEAGTQAGFTGGDLQVYIVDLRELAELFRGLIDRLDLSE